MPRPSKPARAIYSEAHGQWRIHDGAARKATGVRDPGDLEAAEEALRRYLNGRPGQASEETPNAKPDDILIEEILARYGDVRGDEVDSPETLGYSIQMLLTFWGDKRPKEITAENCKAYGTARAIPRVVGGRKVKAGKQTIRRDLGVLQSAIRWAHKDGLIPALYPVTLPKAGAPRKRFLSRRELAAIIWAADKHTRRFILIAYYTGRRAGAILELEWTAIDLELGIIDFLPEGRSENKKVRGAARMPRKLWMMMRLWEQNHPIGPVTYRGRLIEEIDTAFDAACRRAVQRNPKLKLGDVTIHTLKSTGVTHFFIKGGTMDDAVEFFATSAATLQHHYKKHSPRYQARAVEVIDGRPKMTQNHR